MGFMWLVKSCQGCVSVMVVGVCVNVGLFVLLAYLLVLFVFVFWALGVVRFMF